MVPSSSGSELEPLSPEQVQAVRKHLSQVLGSRAFAGSKRAQDFLQLLVDHTLAGREDFLRERMIGAEMFGRPVDYDTANDAVVRVKASEIRRRLSQYYGELESTPAVRIELPVGGYVPRFVWTAGKAFSAVAGAAVPAPMTETTGPAMGQEAEKSVPERPATPDPPEVRRFGRRSLVGFSVVGVGLLAVAGVVLFRTVSLSGQEARSIAILPLLNLSGDPSQEYFADGMTEEITTELGQVSSLRVISRTSTMTYKDTRKSLPQIANELHVEYIVEGSIVRERNRIRVTTQLIDTKTDQHIWAQSYNRDMTSVLDLQSELATAIAMQVRIKLTAAEKQRLSRSRPANPEAVDLYLQGIARSRADNHKEAATFYQQAIARDAGYAPAHAALANAYGHLGEMGWMPYAEAFSQQREEAQKAIDLDDSRPEPHLEIGLAAVNQNWDFVTQEKEFKRALELNPNSSAVHWFYAIYLDRIGRVADGLAEAKLATKLDPVSSFAHANLAYALYYARQYDAALATEEQGVSEHSRPFLRGVIHREQGKFDTAVLDFQQLGDAPHALGHGGNALARAGRVDEARAIIARLNDSITKTDIGRYEIALVYTGLGDKDQAFEWLDKAFRVRDKGITYLLIDPPLDPLRSDPRFQNLVRRVGFPSVSH